MFVENEKALARSGIVMSANAFRLERDAFSPCAHFIRERLVFPAFRAADEIDSHAITSLANCPRIDVPSEIQNSMENFRMFLSRHSICFIYFSRNNQTRLLNDCLIACLQLQ